MVTLEQELEQEVNQVERDMGAEMAELEMHLLEVIAGLKARIQEQKVRLTRYEKLENRLTKPEINPFGTT